MAIVGGIGITGSNSFRAYLRVSLSEQAKIKGGSGSNIIVTTSIGNTLCRLPATLSLATDNYAANTPSQCHANPCQVRASFIKNQAGGLGEDHVHPHMKSLLLPRCMQLHEGIRQ